MKKTSTDSFFNYILKVLYTGMQWKELPIALNPITGKGEIHYSNVYKHFAKWQTDGSWECAFNSSVFFMKTADQLDISVLHLWFGDSKPRI